MGKQGPCYHCGVTSTPLWRNGPPEKPVLCNACGSRWRTKGTLVNYTPLHARPEDDYDDKRIVRVKSISLNKGKEVKPPKRRLDNESLVFDGFASHSQTYHQKFITDEDTSNRSSSGSALSNSDSCAQFESANCSDLTGPAQSVVWDSMVPSRKRTCVGRPKQSSVEQLTRDLYSILQEQQASCFSGTSEDDLLLESETPMVSVEFGHGSVLFRHPNSIVRDEESEASSLSVDNKRHKANDVYSRFPVHKVIKAENLPSPEKIWSPLGHGMERGNLQRDKLQLSKPQVLSNRSSALCSVDLSDVVNFEEFAKNFSAEEQKLLLKYLPSVDKLRTPDSLKNMFGSAQFKENLSSFQELLAEGIFDLSGSRDRGEENKTLKKFVLSSFMKCKWVEQHQKSKESKNAFDVGPQESVSKNADNFMKSTISITQKLNFPDINSTKKMENGGATKVSLESKELLQGSDSSCLSTKKGCLVSKELLQGSDSSCLSTKKGFLESKELLQGNDSSCLSTKKGFLESKELLQGSDSSCLSTKKGCLESKETRVGESSCFSPRTLFMPRVGNGLMVDTFQFSDENSDQDLLLDVPSSGSFPQAELLIPSASSSTGYLRRAFP